MANHRKTGEDMKVFQNKLTDRLGETQFNENAEVLIKNAKSAGFTDAEISIVDMTPAEYDTAIKLQNFNDLDYKQKRAREYPDYREYLDGIVKGDQAQIQKYIDDCKAVKVKYPKILIKEVI